jgi:hypothetical protein
MALRATGQAEELVDQYADPALSHFARQVAGLASVARVAASRRRKLVLGSDRGAGSNLLALVVPPAN